MRVLLRLGIFSVAFSANVMSLSFIAKANRTAEGFETATAYGGYNFREKKQH